VTRELVARSTAAERDVQVVQLKALTERILSRLPGPRILWVLVWMLVPWLNTAVTVMLQAADKLPEWENPTVQLVNRAAFSFAIVLALWGAARITRGLTSLRPQLLSLVEEGIDPMEPFEGMKSAVAPFLLTAATVLLFGTQRALDQGWVGGIVTGVSWVLIGLALWTFIWVYLNLQLGLHRLGRRHLSLKPFPGDRSLGLQPVGRLAFTAFWTFVVLLVPVLLSSVPDRFGLTFGLLVLLAGVAVFFLSLRRLNRQMVIAKQRELEWARHLYAQAFEPVRAAGTLETLERQSSLLSAAEALEKRAERIQEWPFDEGVFARVVAISSTVVAAILARLLLAPLGI